MTLSIDCGGLSIKASVLDEDGTMHAPAVAVPTPYPLTPMDLINVFKDIASKLPKADRITVGFPGMVRHGVVVNTPHYVNVKGPRTKVDPELFYAWKGLDFRSQVEETFKLPTLMLNDAEVHGAGVVAGSGAPHIELSHAPIRRSTIYDEWIGEHERRRLGDSFWSRRIRLMVTDLRPVFHWDRLYLGGGNARRIRPEVLELIGDDVVIVPNAAGIVGGVRAWNLTRV